MYEDTTIKQNDRRINDADIKTQIALIEKDISRITDGIRVLHKSSEKISESTLSIKELLSVHEQKINQQKNSNIELLDLIKTIRIENHEEHLETKLFLSDFSKRMTKIENWKYMVVGGAAAIGAEIAFILSYIIKNIV
mgnify:CR=1 FL=1